jgi:hypothetical protein
MKKTPETVFIFIVVLCSLNFVAIKPRPVISKKINEPIVCNIFACNGA